jgi:hypothetical protein
MMRDQVVHREAVVVPSLEVEVEQPSFVDDRDYRSMFWIRPSAGRSPFITISS